VINQGQLKVIEVIRAMGAFLFYFVLTTVETV